MDVQKMKCVVEIYDTGGIHTCELCGESIRFGSGPDGDGVLSHYFSKHGYTLFHIGTKRVVDDVGRSVSHTVAMVRPN